MKTVNLAQILAGILLTALVISGCSAYLALEENERALSAKDIIALSKAGVSSEIIKRKIEVTRSQFNLETEDIVRLKNEGVSDDVIHSMIDTGEAAGLVDLERSYSLYDYWFNYYNTFYPVYIYRNPTWGAYLNPMYRSGESLGWYYRDFPVGLPWSGYTEYPRYWSSPPALGERDR